MNAAASGVIDIQEDSVMASVDSWVDRDEDDRIICRDNFAYVLDARPRIAAVKQLVLELGIRPTERGCRESAIRTFSWPTIAADNGSCPQIGDPK